MDSASAIQGSADPAQTTATVTAMGMRVLGNKFPATLANFEKSFLL